MIQLKNATTILLIFVLFFPIVGNCAPKEAPYVIGRDDILDITVWQSPDLTKSLTVQSDGTIDYPLIGNLPAAGLTPPDLQKTIQDKLSQGFVKDPKVIVSIKEYNSKKILVFGEVGKPGLFKIKGPVPVLELLFMVGGANPDAKRMTVIRPTNPSSSTFDASEFTTSPVYSEQKAAADNSAQTIKVDLIALLSKGDLSQNVLIAPGDTIYVASGTGLRYHVLGQVGNPGPYEWSQDITVLEAIKLAGGVNSHGAPNRIKVRKVFGNGQKQEIKINVLEIMNGKKKDDVIIKPGDTIIVPESWI